VSPNAWLAARPGPCSGQEKVNLCSPARLQRDSIFWCHSTPAGTNTWSPARKTHTITTSTTQALHCNYTVTSRERSARAFARVASVSLYLSLSLSRSLARSLSLSLTNGRGAPNPRNGFQRSRQTRNASLKRPKNRSSAIRSSG